jgi:hypothetical protein
MVVAPSAAAPAETHESLNDDGTVLTQPQQRIERRDPQQ